MRTFAFTVFWFSLLGPLVGGALWNVFIIPIPLSYIVGLIPAMLGGTFYAMTSRRRGSERSEARVFLHGALCGGLATLLCLGVYLASLPHGFAFFNPIEALRREPYPGTPYLLHLWGSLAPSIAGLIVIALGSIAGGVCAISVERRLRPKHVGGTIDP